MEDHVSMSKFKLSFLWSCDCSPLKYATKCAVFTFGQVLIIGYFVDAYSANLTEQTMMFLCIAGLITGIMIGIITFLVTWLLRRGKSRIYQLVEQSLFWWLPLLMFINYLDWVRTVRLGL